MKSTLTRIRKLGKQYRRFSINYGIPLLILGVVWGNIKGYVKTTYEYNNQIGDIKEERKRKQEVKKLIEDFEYLRARTEQHICTHSRSIEECPMILPHKSFTTCTSSITKNFKQTLFIKVFDIDMPIDDIDRSCD